MNRDGSDTARLLTRRRFLRHASLATAGMLSAACTRRLPDSDDAANTPDVQELTARPTVMPTATIHQSETPAWVAETVVYGVIVRNFGNEGFKSVTERLDYLADLGINALWLSPVNDSPAGDYGYAVADYFELNPKYGTKDDFRAMIEAAHARDIRVLMDFVPNHTSDQHPYFQDAQQNGTDSQYYDWYDRDEDGNPTHYFDWTNLPNLNYDNPDVEAWMLDAFSYWVREFDVDGFRVDVAWGVKRRKPAFWPKWRETLWAIKPDMLLLAEASARDPYYCTHGFDVAYDWTGELGHWAWENVFEDRTKVVERLHAALTNNGNGFHPETRIFRFLNNNDTGTRFITSYGEDMTRVAAALLLTLPGVPCVYTGDEVGEWFRPYYDPQPIIWEDKYGLRDYYKTLIALRKEMPALHSQQWLPLDVTPAEQVYGYVRFREEYSDPVLVLLNFSADEVTAEVTLPDDIQSFGAGASLRDRLADERVSIQPSSPLRVPMPASTARILVNQT